MEQYANKAQKIKSAYQYSHRQISDKALLFKASVRYFLSNFYFQPNDSPSTKTMKNVF